LDHLWSPWRMSYLQKHTKEPGCIFCTALEREDGPENLVVYRGKTTFAILNMYPYTSGHLMIVPCQHKPSLEKLDIECRGELMEIAAAAVQVLKAVYHPQGFNVGFNIGEAAGAGIESHIHMHVVPRWNGDTNFMSTLGMTRVLPETLEESYHRIRDAWANFFRKP